MRNQLEQIKTLFEQVRGLGIVMQLPDNNHTPLSKNITVYFAENCNVTSIQFGRGDEKVDIMKYSINDSYLKVSLGIDSTDEQLDNLITIVKSEYLMAKKQYFEDEIVILERQLEEVAS